MAELEKLFSNNLSHEIDLTPLRHRKGVVIGCGAVGMAIAYAMLIKNQFSELVLVDVNRERLEGEVMDLQQAAAFTGPCVVRAGEVADCDGAHIVVITAGAAQRPGESRLDLVQRNVEILRSIVPTVAEVAPQSVVIPVSNPVDIITYAAIKLSGMPPSRVIGSGTVLDTGRYRVALAEKLQVAPASVHGYILGEHGDSEFAAWSMVNVGGTPLCDASWEGSPPANDPDLHALFDNVRTAAYQIIQRKGYTSWAIGLATTRIVQSVLGNEGRVLPVSVLLQGEFGLEDVCLAVPTVVTRNGAMRIVNCALNETELQFLHDSARTLKEVIAGIKW